MRGGINMFEDAIKNSNTYVRCINTIQRTYKSDKIKAVSSSIVFVNDDGCAICSRQTADMLIAGDHIFRAYHEFKEAKKGLHDDYRYEIELEELEEKYHLKEGAICDIKNIFVGCYRKFEGFEIIKHPKYDLALIRFKNGEDKQYTSHAVFAKKGGLLRPGKELCRVGFPFAEFNNFKYDAEKDELEWIHEGNSFSPFFPQFGMVTRNVVDNGINFSFELSTANYQGMQGGPVFDEYGVVYGLCSLNAVIPNGYLPVPYNVVIEGNKTPLATSPYALLGRVINNDIIKQFLSDNKVTYFEDDIYDIKAN